MRDEQVRRYARHILLPDFGGLGQAALLVSVGALDLRSGDPAGRIAARYLAAAGIGTLALIGGTDADALELRALGPDTSVVLVTAPEGAPERARPIALPDRPPWWPAAGDGAPPTTPTNDVGLAHWRGASAAVSWIAAATGR